MKYTIEGFSQEYAISLKKNVPVKDGKEKQIKIDCTDLVILRWFVDFYPNMKKMTIGGKEYVWLTHKKLITDLPLLDISKRACIERMQKLVEFGILDYKLIKEGGTFSLYAFGKNYINLIRSNDIGEPVDNTGGIHSNDIGGVVQPDNKDNSIIDTSFNNTSNNTYKEIIDYLNEKAGTNFKVKSKNTQQHINARLKEGFTVEDFKTVIDKKCVDWKNTEWEQYLRPATLFGTKFESYLNAKSNRNQQKETPEYKQGVDYF